MDIETPRKTKTSIHRLNVIVIGGSSGIGASIVTKYAENGHYVLSTYFSNEMGALETKKKFQENVDFVFLDQGELDSVEQFGHYVSQWLKKIQISKRSEDVEGNEEEMETLSFEEEKIDVLLNNAALGSATVIGYVDRKLASLQLKSPASNMRRRAMEDESLMKVNSLGPLWITDVLQDMMRGSNRSSSTSSSPEYPPSSPCQSNPIHTNSSSASLHSWSNYGLNPSNPSPQMRDYSTIIFMGSVGGSTGVFPEYRASDLMSKAAVTYLSKHLAAENIQTHVDVVCLSPGATLTDMFRKSTLEPCSNPGLFMSLMPKRRLIEPRELAEAAYVLGTERWARIFHGGVLDASLGLGVRPGLQTEIRA